MMAREEVSARNSLRYLLKHLGDAPVFDRVPRRGERAGSSGAAEVGGAHSAATAGGVVSLASWQTALRVSTGM